MSFQDTTPERTNTPLAAALGWFSVALGAAEILAPGQVARLIGVRPSERTCGLLRAYGAREMTSGLGILGQPAGAHWLWSRVGGDAIDLATLGSAAADDTTDRRRLAFAAAAVAGVAVLDYIAARHASRRHDEEDLWWSSDTTLSNEQALTIRAPIERVEEAWVDWCASGYSRLRNNYVVRFEPAPAARGTEIRLSGGASRSAVREELRRFKQVVETGEITLSDGPGLWRPAQPPRSPEELKKLVEVL